MPAFVTRRAFNAALFAATTAPLLPAAAPVFARPAAVTRLVDIAIAGGWYYALPEIRDALVPGEKLVLRAEPDNPHDANAVVVSRADGTKLGYVPRAANEPIARLLAAGRMVEATVVEPLAYDADDDAEIPDDFVFTGFADGDPRVRLTLLDEPDVELRAPQAR